MTQDTIPFDKLSGLRELSSSFSQLGNDYIFSRITENIFVPHPTRVSGVTCCLLLKGSLSFEINGQEYSLSAPSLMTFNSQSVVSLPKDSNAEFDAYVLFMSMQFLQDLNINLNAINFEMIERDPSPVIDNLSSEELEIVKAYLDLLARNANTNMDNVYTKNASRSLVQALLYQLMQIKFDHTHQVTDNDPQQTRRMTYVKDFMRLVQLHHFKERNLAFYAEKLFISPKYLSRIIKENTGRSAADWIDQFVILEAKNMLRFSNKNIQQVAYALNFPTQSSFGKFFKHITGMSPSDYQKT